MAKKLQHGRECKDSRSSCPLPMKDGRKENPEMNDMRYVTGIPRKPLEKGRVLAHNHVLPQRQIRVRGFRAWTQTLDEHLEVCKCSWAGKDLRGLTHYRVKGLRQPQPQI